MNNKTIRFTIACLSIAYWIQSFIGISKAESTNVEQYRLYAVILLVGYGIMTHMAKEEE